MCKEHIKAIKEFIKGKATTLPILKEVAHMDGKLLATNLEVAVEITTPNIKDGVYKAEVLELGFKEELLDKEYTTEDYPEIQTGSTIGEYSYSGEDIAKMIRAGEFVSKDQTRPVLTGVSLKGSKVYGSDGFQLYSNRLNNDISIPITLPIKLIKLFKAVKADKHNWTMTIYEDDMVSLTSGNITLYSKVISGQQPDYDGLLTDNSVNTTITLDLATLNAPKDWLVLADREDNTIYLTDGNWENKVEISKQITLEDGTYEPTDERNIIMAMVTHESKRYVGVNPKLLKPYGKHTIKLYARNKMKGQLEVEIIK